MLFAQKFLAPGPQPKQPGNVNPARGGTPGKPGVCLNEIRGLRFQRVPGNECFSAGDIVITSSGKCQRQILFLDKRSRASDSEA
jgi:hypothetical protein